jgi:hypothetical protein
MTSRGPEVITPEEIAKQLVDAVAHTLSGNGPASVRLHGPHGMEDGAVVFVIPGPVGIIVDEALHKLYGKLGWKVQQQGQGEAR